MAAILYRSFVVVRVGVELSVSNARAVISDRFIDLLYIRDHELQVREERGRMRGVEDCE